MSDTTFYLSPCCGDENWKILIYKCDRGHIFKEPRRVHGDEESLMQKYRTCTFAGNGETYVDVCPRCERPWLGCASGECRKCGTIFSGAEIILETCEYFDDDDWEEE